MHNLLCFYQWSEENKAWKLIEGQHEFKFESGVGVIINSFEYFVRCACVSQTLYF
jgi:hypothetical protein